MEKLSANRLFKPSLLLQAQNLRNQLQRSTSEITTLMASDTAKALRGDLTVLAGQDHSLARLAAFKTSAQELQTQASVAQSALTLMHDTSLRLGNNILSVGSAMTSTQVSSFTKSGADGFATLISTLNSSAAGKAVFSGVTTDQSPLPAAEVLLADLETLLAGLTDLDQIETTINDWFTGSTGYETHYAGSVARDGLYIASGERAGLELTALDPAVRATLAQFAKLALLDRGLLSGDSEGQHALVMKGAEGLIVSSDLRIDTAARVGVLEEKLAKALERNTAETSALSTSRLALVAVDPYEAAVRLQEIEARLDTFYTITARLSTLSLVEYLR